MLLNKAHPYIYMYMFYIKSTKKAVTMFKIERIDVEALI